MVLELVFFEKKVPRHLERVDFHHDFNHEKLEQMKLFLEGFDTIIMEWSFPESKMRENLSELFIQVP